jgi:N-methylhydantoinase B
MACCVGVSKGGTLTQVEGAVMSYCCDRARSVTWGIGGGLPSIPHGVWLNRWTEQERFLGANFSGVPVVEGDFFERPSGGGGGLGDRSSATRRRCSMMSRTAT